MGTRELPRPRRRLDIRMGFACNNNCRFCVLGSEKRREHELPNDEVRAIIDKVWEDGTTTLVFTGGEPTIRKDLAELISYAGRYEFSEIILISNGRMLSYKGYIDDLVAGGLTTISFSLPSHRPEVYNHLTRTANGWDQLERAMENARRHPLTVCTITCITKPIVPDLPDLARFLATQKDRFHRFFAEFIFVNPSGNARADWKNIVPRMSEAVPNIHASLDIAAQAGYPLNVEGVPLCHMVGYEDRVIELTMAPEWEMREPGRPGFDQNRSRRENTKMKTATCRQCRYDAVCEGPWRGYAELFGFDEFRSVPGEPVTDPAVLISPGGP